MALRSKALSHGRSLSLPSKSHPAISQFTETLAVIKASEPTFSSLSSMENRLSGLKSLYCNIDDLLTLPHVQQIISEECQEKWADQIMNGYIRVLDGCTTAKDLFSQTKHDVQELLSALRRKDVNGVHSYQTSRKNSKKMIQKSLKDLRSSRSKHSDGSVEKDEETMALVCMLKEAELASIAVLESSLSYVMGSKASGWSFLPKLAQLKKVSNEAEVNEFKKVDSSLQMNQGEDAQLVNHLKEMESSIQLVEEELQCLFRQFIKTRVFLLNILNL